jgi:hypothetical protein
MEAICSSETSLNFQRTTRRYIPEYSTLQNNCCQNIKTLLDFVLNTQLYQNFHTKISSIRDISSRKVAYSGSDVLSEMKNSARRLPLLFSWLAYFSTLKMEAICSPETSGCLRTTRRCNPESRALRTDNWCDSFRQLLLRQQLHLLTIALCWQEYNVVVI